MTPLSLLNALFRPERSVEVADLDGGARAVRDSKNSTGAALTFTAAVCAGEFD
ncbi:MAG: DUF397 domain-containing protein [Pseudonocardiaceae bacterium]